MKRILIAAAVVGLWTPVYAAEKKAEAPKAAASAPAPEPRADQPITITYGDLNALIALGVAPAKAQEAVAAMQNAAQAAQGASTKLHLQIAAPAPAPTPAATPKTEPEKNDP